MRCSRPGSLAASNLVSRQPPGYASMVSNRQRFARFAPSVSAQAARPDGDSPPSAYIPAAAYVPPAARDPMAIRPPWTAAEPRHAQLDRDQLLSTGDLPYLRSAGEPTSSHFTDSVGAKQDKVISIADKIDETSAPERSWARKSRTFPM